MYLLAIFYNSFDI